MIMQMGIGALAAANLTALNAFAETLPDSDPLPGLFIGHGNPMNAIEGKPLRTWLSTDCQCDTKT